MKRTLAIIFLVFLIFLATINFFITFKVPFLGYRIYKVSSNSMKPELKYNDFVLIKENATFKENDIITFKTDEGTLTHRVLELRDDGKIVTRGDAMTFDNDPITKDMVVGKMVYKFVVLTFINYFLFKPIFWVVFLILAIAILYFKMKKNYK